MSTLLRNRRLRLLAFWGLFSLAALATAGAMWVLHTSVQQAQAEETARLVAQETERAQARVREFAARVRHSTLAELAGFHADGLARALRRWDEANAVVVGTFQWEPGRGFTGPGAFNRATVDPGELVALWEDQTSVGEGNVGTDRLERSAGRGAWRTSRVRLMDNPEFPAGALGYQAENLDVMAYAGHPVDPWGGWAARADRADLAWVFWYRPGPGAPVRGCFVDVEPLLGELRELFVDTALVRIAIEPAGQADAADRGGALEAFPAHRLVAAPGSVLAERQMRVRTTLAVVASLAAVFVAGAGILGIYSRREARDAERKSTFVSQVSHELRTPLTSIRMFADMLATPGLPEEKRLKFAGTISRESQRLSGLIERLLTFNALDKGKVVAVRSPVDLTSLLHETLDDQAAVLAHAGMRLERRFPDGPIVVRSDRDAAKQALINLLDNAAKYARDGGIVRVALERHGRTATVRVSDDGPGIPPAARSRIFEPFVQGGGSALTDKAPGLGLGLSIARGLLRRAGADLVLVPSDRGAVFDLRFPVEDESLTHEHAPPAQGSRC